MKINEFKKLEKKINNQNFNQGYKNINLVMLLLSIFGHFASIFLAYFALSKVLGGVIENNPVVVLMASLIMLTGLELLKRDIFDKFSIQYLKVKAFTKDVLPLFILSLLIICTSFYASIQGAKEFSSKEAVIEKKQEETVNQFSDSLNKVYNIKIDGIESEIKVNKDKIDSKDKEQTELEAIQPPTRSQKSRIKDLKDEKTTLRTDITKLETDEATVKTELATKIKEHEATVGDDAKNKKEDNNSNSLAFVLISTLIELVILVGVYFNEYYKFRSYKEFRNRLEKDPNYQKWMIYDQMLSIIYTEDTKMNQKLPSNKNIADMCKVNDIIVMPKDVTDFLKVMNNLNIIKTSGSTRYVNKQRDLAFEILRKQFNIQ
jgi:heme/copper-type cytochrome/quinol oxidase subunit 3